MQSAQMITFQIASCFLRTDSHVIMWEIEQIMSEMEELKERMQRMHPEEDASVEWEAAAVFECWARLRRTEVGQPS